MCIIISDILRLYKIKFIRKKLIIPTPKLLIIKEDVGLKLLIIRKDIKMEE